MLVVLAILLLWLSLSSLIYFIIRRKKITLSYRQIALFFGCKIIAGAVYGYIYKRYYGGDDTWSLNHDGFLQYKRLLASPFNFFKEIFSAHPYFYDDTYYLHPFGYLTNLENCIVIKTIAIFNIISHGNYYINIVFFNFIGFLGLYLFYKLVTEGMNKSNQRLTATVIFLFPPSIFWLSGLRGEGLMIFFSGILFYQFNLWLQQKKATVGIWCIGSFSMLYILRDGFAASLLPALIAWWLIIFFKLDTKKTFAAVYFILLISIAAESILLPQNWNILSVIANRQHDFFALQGNTRFNLTPLDSSFISFIKVFPESLLNTFIRPFPWEAKGVLQWFAVIENVFMLLLVIITIFKFYAGCRKLSGNPILWMLLIAGLSNYAIIGYIVPFPGAIIRYKTIPELFILSACLMCIVKGLSSPKNHSITAVSQI
jgi:hypothetical protein